MFIAWENRKALPLPDYNILRKNNVKILSFLRIDICNLENKHMENQQILTIFPYNLRRQRDGKEEMWRKSV
jgi:hypothetical protein